MSDAATKHLTIYGASDDLIEVEGDVPGCDEYSGEKATFVVAGIRVHVRFTGNWVVGVEPIDEDVPPTATNMRLSIHERGYSAQLDLDVPGGSYVTREDRAND